LSNVLIRILANALIELRCNNYPKIFIKLILEAIGLGYIKALLNKRELILIKLGKCNSNKFVITLTTSSFALTF